MKFEFIKLRGRPPKKILIPVDLIRMVERGKIIKFGGYLVKGKK